RRSSDLLPPAVGLAHVVPPPVARVRRAVAAPAGGEVAGGRRGHAPPPPSPGQPVPRPSPGVRARPPVPLPLHDAGRAASGRGVVGADRGGHLLAAHTPGAGVPREPAVSRTQRAPGAVVSSSADDAE